MLCIGCLLCCWSSPFLFVNQGYKGILAHFNRHTRTVEPGLCYINPVTESLTQVDVRMNVMDLDLQIILTKDNININLDACVYYTIT
jgi:erythrocyte band 7 integral membrane protein